MWKRGMVRTPEAESYEPTGIDINETMVKVCQDKGLDVVNMDAIEYLKKLDENSVILITGFQVVEHLHFNQLNELMKEISRVLDDDGIVILETPNPYNLEVGACNFYVDPTHKRPLHPSLLEFLAQVNGISKTEIVLWKSEEIDKWWNSVVESDETDIFNSSSYRTVVSSIKGSLYNSPDYALVGIKNGNL
jgi:O-antigen chain-terminating methyltransferase